MLRFGAITVTVVVGWLAVSRGAVPHLIRASHRGEGLVLFRRIMAGRDSVPVEEYLGDWLALARTGDLLLGLGALALFAVLFTRLPERLRRFADRVRKLERAGAGRRSLRPVHVLGLGATFGLLTGWIAGAYLAFESLARQRAVPHFRITSADILWVAPLSHLAWFLALGILLAVVARATARARAPRPILFVLLLASGMSLLMLPGWLHWGAALLVSLGIAFQASRVLAVHAGHLGRPARWATVALAGAVVVAAGAVPAVRWASERSAIATLPPPRDGAPDVLLVVLDAVRARNLGLHGYDRPTSPVLERLAREGVVFERAYAPAPWSLSSHATLLSGRYSAELGTGFFRPLDERHRLLPEALREHGYLTVASIGNTIYGTRQWGLDRGIVRYRAARASASRLLRGSWPGRELLPELRALVGARQMAQRVRASVVNRDLLEWVEEAGDRPYFALVNYFDVHAPYLAPEPFDRRFDSREGRYWWDHETAPAYSEEELQQLVASYDECIRYVDHALGRLLDSLERAGRLDNTLLIVTSDHGEAFMEHGQYEHAASLYVEELHVPLLVRFPGRVPAGVRIEPPVSPGDVPRTVLDLLGLEEEAEAFGGRSLARHWRAALDPSAPPPAPEPVFAELRGRRAVFFDRWHYLAGGGEPEELYDLSTDPMERRDLADEPSARDALARGRSALARFRASPGLPPVGSNRRPPRAGTRDGG